MQTLLAFEPASSLTAGNLTLAAGDIIALLTGETDKNNLSAMCSPGGTTIASTYPAGWEVWDDDTGTSNEWVLRAPTVDDATQYKYVKLRFYSSNSYMYIGHRVMEDWNPTTNIGTNMCTEDAVNYCRFPTQSYGPNTTMEIMATARYIMFRTNLYSATFSVPAMEISRIHPSLAIGTGRVPVVQMANNMFQATNYTTYYASIPRILDDGGTTDLTAYDIRCTNGGGRGSTNLSNEFDNITAEIAYDDSNNPFYGIQNILFERRETIGQVCGDSTVADVFIMQGGALAGFEDRTLHTLDTTDDRRIMWHDTINITTHGDIRWVIRAE